MTDREVVRLARIRKGVTGETLLQAVAALAGGHESEGQAVDEPAVVDEGGERGAVVLHLPPRAVRRPR